MNRIREWLNEMGRTATEAAAAIPCAEGYLSFIINGKRPMQWWVAIGLYRWARSLDPTVNFQWLFGLLDADMGLEEQNDEENPHVERSTG